MDKNKGRLIYLMKLLNINVKNIKDLPEINEGSTSSVIDFNSDFENRLRLQKIVYLLETKYKYLFTYRFTLYLRGPYSTKLTKDYFAIDGQNFTSVENIPAEIIKMAKKLNSKDPLWLEIASTIKMMYIENKNDVIERTIDLKSDVLTLNDKQDSYVKVVYQELKSMNLT